MDALHAPAEAGSRRRLAEEPLAERYRRTRALTLELAAPLSIEDMVPQSMPDASPVKWHLAHTSWFFETFVLLPARPGHGRFDESFAELFNSYYVSMGPRAARAERGLVTRPGVERVLAWRAHVDEAMETLLAEPGLDPRWTERTLLGLVHEEQHAELLLMDVQHLFSRNPAAPAYAALDPVPPAIAPPMGFAAMPGGLAAVGTDDLRAFDAERPRHRVYLPPFQLADRLVTNGEWLQFMEAGGYERPEFWLSDGWARAEAEGWRAPLYWEDDRAGGWRQFTLGGPQPLAEEAPVAHVSYFEADAFARWAGARLPTEAEWEQVAGGRPPRPGDGLAPGRLRPWPGEGEPFADLYGQLWQWTQSAFAPHPGFRPGPGALGEYNGKFMVNQIVLKGGSCWTPRGHSRSSYRNFFYPHQRWMAAGVRLALDGDTPPAPAERFRHHLAEGLGRAQKTIEPRWFYDEQGSALFERITALPSYYPTRQEMALIEREAPAMAALLPTGGVLVDYGAGSGVKAARLLAHAPQAAAYVPVDISPAALAEARLTVEHCCPALGIHPVEADFLQPFRLPPAVAGRPLMGFFPGSTIGNLSPRQARRFLAAQRQLLGAGGRLVVGVDLVKDEETLVAAYDDPERVTAAFNRNLLLRANREAEAGFDPDRFRHVARWNAALQRIEMHLESLKAHEVEVAGGTIRFAAGETIHTENCAKFTRHSLAALAGEAGWRLGAWLESPAPAVALAVLEPA